MVGFTIIGSPEGRSAVRCRLIQIHMALRTRPVPLKYCTFSFKSTGGVTRDPFYLFDISAAAEFLCDTFKISAFELKISSFLHFWGSLGTCVTAWRFDRGLSDT
jgi:hypothetical protein